MSLLDDVSIVVTPNGYKAGELYAVVPVPTEGSEEVTNGDFANGSDDWTTTPTGVTFSGGFANFTSGQDTFIIQTFLTVGKRYKISVDYNITSIISGYFGTNGTSENNVSLAGLTGSGTLTDYIIAGTTSLIFRSSNFNGSITNVSVKEYTAADMDVTRATAATRVDEAGLVNYAEIIGSEEVTNGDFSNGFTDWTENGDSITIVDGAARINRVSTTTYIQQNVLTSGKTYLVEFDVLDKVDNSGTFTVRLGSNYVYDVVTYEGTKFSKLITAANIDFRVYSSSNNGVIYIDNISVKEVTRDNVPRIDYTGGGCPHILAEPQRTNLIPYSEGFSQWSNSGFETSNYSVSPDGTQNASRYLFTGSGQSSQILTSVSSGIEVSGSLYIKGVSGETIQIASGGADELFTLTSDWKRYDSTRTALNSSFNINTYGGATARDIQVWGAQLEIGSFPTSYIPTSGSTVTRNQDQFSRDGIGSLINSTEGCVFGEGNFAESNSSSYNYFLSLSDGTANNRLEIRQSVSNLQFLWRVATYQSEISTSGLDVSSNFKFAVSYSSANIKFYVNGNLIGTISSPTLWTANTLNRLAFDDGAGGNRLSGKVKQLQVYKTALTDTQLAALTS